MFTETEERIITDNIGLANKIAWMNVDKAEFDDLKQVCCISLMKASRSYNPERGKFAPFAARIMQNDINSYLRQQKYIPQESIYDHEIPYEIEEELENNIMIGQIRQILSKEEFSLLFDHHVNGMTQAALAEKNSCSQSHVCSTLTRIKQKVRVCFDGN